MVDAGVIREHGRFALVPDQQRFDKVSDLAKLRQELLNMGVRLQANDKGDRRERDVHLYVLLLLVIEEPELFGTKTADGVAVAIVNPCGGRNVLDADHKAGIL